jgi:hypothetical protein
MAHYLLQPNLHMLDVSRLITSRCNKVAHDSAMLLPPCQSIGSIPSKSTGILHPLGLIHNILWWMLGLIHNTVVDARAAHEK